MCIGLGLLDSTLNTIASIGHYECQGVLPASPSVLPYPLPSCTRCLRFAGIGLGLLDSTLGALADIEAYECQDVLIREGLVRPLIKALGGTVRPLRAL